MSERTRKHHTNIKRNKDIICASTDGNILKIPYSVAKPYIIQEKKLIDVQKIKKLKNNIEHIEKALLTTHKDTAIFQKINEQYTQHGALLKGIRLREGLSQKDFAEKVAIKQPELSKLENGKRAIGKKLAKRIATMFNTDYRLFL